MLQFFIKPYFHKHTLSSSIKSASAQQNQSSKLLLTVSEWIIVPYITQMDLESARPRPASWLYAKFHTHACCDWINTENTRDSTQPRDPASTEAHPRFCFFTHLFLSSPESTGAYASNQWYTILNVYSCLTVE